MACTIAGPVAGDRLNLIAGDGLECAGGTVRRRHLHPVDAETVSVARKKLALNDCIVAPDRNEALLKEAGFKAIETFYVGMAWRGWVAYR